MAIPNKLYFPQFLATTPCGIVLEQDALSEDGNLVEGITWTGNVIFTEKTQRIINADGSVTIVKGEVILQGDIAPDTIVSSGIFTVYPGTIHERKYRLHSCLVNKNPDGTAHSTYLELM